VYLVDTNILSAGAPTKSVAHRQLADWMDRNSLALFLSVVTIAEIEDGVAKCRRQGATQKADRLADWLKTVLHLYSARILPLDIVVAQGLGRLSDRARSQGIAPGFADLTIAATAWHHGCTVLTRNLRHFEPMGVAALDPFAMLPGDAAQLASGRE
jgi:predicted nucleic acid-binding protein